MRRVKKACVSSSAIPSWWSTQPSRVTLMLKVKSPMATSFLRVGRTVGLSLIYEVLRGGADLVSSIRLLGRLPRRRECFLEKNDLAPMVQVVLRRAAELSVRRVLGAQFLREALRGEGPHGVLELLIQLFQGVLALAPSL